ncbi:MAG: DUF6153 family protein [Ornithinimicrobium sp.]|jgi:hypothetical protein|uniref:DUF6153 family protein n=1 Tax=Ornithinimicrobium sp. TaxID=1977084 RepID=UPI003D9B5A31
MQSTRPLVALRVLAVLLFVLGISSMHSPDISHPSSAAPSASTAMTDMSATDPPVHDGGGSPAHQRWLGGCLAVLGALSAVLALSCPTPRSTPKNRARRHRSARFDPAARAWSPPTPSLDRLCVMRV